MNPDVHIVARQANIKDEDFNQDYFREFTMVMNALDNLDARRHVNRLCLAQNINLIESGTQGYMGQVRCRVSCIRLSVTGYADSSLQDRML